MSTYPPIHRSQTWKENVPAGPFYPEAEKGILLLLKALRCPGPVLAIVQSQKATCNVVTSKKGTALEPGDLDKKDEMIRTTMGIKGWAAGPVQAFTWVPSIMP